MIDFAEVSVIVQGAISREYAPRCLASIRLSMPKAEIILSVAENAAYHSLDYDQLVLTEDPGAFLIDEKNRMFNNVNRQIVSSAAGLRCAKRAYALKFRTDIDLLSADWIRCFNLFDTKCPAAKFKNRVLICNYYTRNPRILPIPYHASDWIMFGNRDDLLAYFDTGLLHEKEPLWFQSHPKSSLCFEHMLSRYMPEQYLCIGFLKRYEDIRFENYYDCSKKYSLHRTFFCRKYSYFEL